MYTYGLKLTLIYKQHPSLPSSGWCVPLCHSPEHPLLGSGTQQLLLIHMRPCGSRPAGLWPLGLTLGGAREGIPEWEEVSSKKKLIVSCKDISGDLGVCVALSQTRRRRVFTLQQAPLDFRQR